MLLFFLFVFFKQKTAYEMRISDWSSDVCSSEAGAAATQLLPQAGEAIDGARIHCTPAQAGQLTGRGAGGLDPATDPSLDIERAGHRPRTMQAHPADHLVVMRVQGTTDPDPHAGVRGVAQPVGVQYGTP